MSLYRTLQALLSVNPAVNTDQTGNTYAVVPNDSDNTADHQMTFRVFIDASQNGGVTAPTVTVHVETSHDGTNWVAALNPTTLNADGSVSKFEAITALGPLIRARTVLQGATKPNHTATVKLSSNGAFRLQKV